MGEPWSARASSGRAVWRVLRLLLLGVLWAVVIGIALYVLELHMICPKRYLGCAGPECYCDSFGWSVLNFGAATLLFAAAGLLVRNLGRSVRLVLFAVPVAWFCLTTWGLTNQASDMDGVETYDQARWDHIPHEGPLAYAGAFVAFSLLGVAVWRGRSKKPE